MLANSLAWPGLHGLGRVIREIDDNASATSDDAGIVGDELAPGKDAA